METSTKYGNEASTEYGHVNERYTAEYEDFNTNPLDFETKTFSPHHAERGRKRLLRLLRNQASIGLTKDEQEHFSEVWEQRHRFSRDEIDEIEEEYMV